MNSVPAATSHLPADDCHHQPFVHLPVQSEFSLLDGLSRIDDLAARAKVLNQPALALTDQGTIIFELRDGLSYIGASTSAKGRLASLLFEPLMARH